MQTALRLQQINLPEIEILSIKPSGLRDYFDFTIAEGKLGLYANQEKNLVDLTSCLQLSPALQEFYQQFRKIRWPIKKGSVRLRVSPENQRGAWLDFSHLDVQALFAEENSLSELMEICVVEVGQRHKSLHKTDRLRLTDPILRPWSQTWNQGKAIPLYGHIATFSQTGSAANQVIIQTLQDLLQKIAKLEHIFEYGCGNGNLTFAVLDAQRRISVLETDPHARSGLELTATQLALREQIHFANSTTELQKFDLLLANPPRSGLQNFLARPLPANLLYMSCSLQSFTQDAQQIQNLNYQLKDLKIIDQFPQTKHFEIISRWQR